MLFLIFLKLCCTQENVTQKFITTGSIACVITYFYEILHDSTCEIYLAIHNKHHGILCKHVITHEVQVTRITNWKMDFDEVPVRIATIAQGVINSTNIRYID